MGAAAYRILKDIDNYNKLGGMQKQLNDTIINLQMVNLVAARQNYAINTIVKLQLSGMTEDQILKTCRIIEANGVQSMNSLGLNAH